MTLHYKFNHLRRSAMLLILLLAGWAAGIPASASTEVVLIPDPATNLQGTGTETAIQPLESFTNETYGVSVEFFQNGGTQAPAYYYNGNNIRLYSGNSFTVNCSNSYIERIEFQSEAYKSDENTLITEGEQVMYDPETLVYTWEGTYSMWGGGMTSVQFYVQNTQLRLTRITVVLAGDIVIEGQLKSPTFSRSSGSFSENFKLTLTDSNDPVATIRYTVDGTTPDATTGSVYTGPIEIAAGADVTVKAVAVSADNRVSNVSSATYTYVQKYRLTVNLTNPGGLRYYYLSTNSDYGQWSENHTILTSDGESVWVQLECNTGYRIKSITLNGTPVSTAQNYFDFTMPAEDVTVNVETLFDPSSPSDPQPGDTTRLYKLSLVSNPAGAGTFTGAGLYPAGTEVNVRCYANSNYGFTGSWTQNGKPLDITDRYFTFTMPAEDVVLTAGYIYSPTSPDDPQQPALKHPLTAVASPAGAGTVSVSASQVTFGQSYTVTARANSGYRLKGWIINGEPQETTSSTISATMTEKGAQVVALFVFNPASPDDPNGNAYNAETGQMILDHFTPGNLYSVAYTLTNGNFANVSHMIVKGVMNSNDLSSLSSFDNAETIDISRTGGITDLGSYTFNNVAASTVVLPYTVANMGSFVFSNCANLSSIICYAFEPPKCISTTFGNFSNSQLCTVYVPAESVPLYEDADGWKNFVILPITTDAHVLQVNLPDACSDGRYKNNTIEIVNLSTGIRQKYVVTDRLLYTFNGLQKDEQYNVYLYSQAGLEIGRIENVMIPDRDTAVTFESLRNLFNVSASVTTPDGKDITSETTVEWLKPMADGSSAYLRKTVTLGEIPDGQVLICRVSLPESIGTLYKQPDDVEFTVDSNNNVCQITLTPIRSITLSGKVVDGDGLPLADASISANQTLNGRYNKTLTAKTDRQGKWSLSVLDAPATHLTFSATECVNLNDTIGSFEPEISTLDLGKIALRSIVGARVTYGFTYLAAGADEADSYYSDYQNVAVSVYNITQNRAHNDVSLQYPVIAILDENIHTGDELRITATSKNGSFKPIEQTVTINDNQRGEVTFNIIGKGGIAASFEMTDNKTVIGMLYSDKGELLTKGTYSEAQLSFAALDKGNYTLVTMGQSELMNSILRLDNFSEIGLKEGQDYVKNIVTVENGKLSEVRNNEVPMFDESLFYYTTESTGFSVNKSSITTGNYLTLRSAIDFKGVYKTDISNVALVIDLPEACDLVESSVIQGSNLLPYTLDSNRLTIQLGNNYQGQVRFCVIPTTGGTFNTTASVQFAYNNRTITQPIGSASSTVKDIEITVPSVIAGTEFKVTGTANAYSEIKIFENGTLLGSGKANAIGSWNVECELPQPYNLSTYSIYAEITTPAGNTLVSESKNLTYDMNALQVSKVTMYHWNPEENGWTGKMYTSEFDFINPKTTPTQWTVYYPKKKFTYTIEFTDNDPERISNVVLYVHTADGKVVPCNATFDEQKKLWFTEIDMGCSSDGYYPVNCSVDFDYTAPVLGDANRVNDIITQCEASLGDDMTLNSIIHDINNTVNIEESAFEDLFKYLDTDYLDISDIPTNISEFIDEILSSPEQTGYEFNNGVLTYIDESGTPISMNCIYAKTNEDITLDDYTSIVLTDGTNVYINVTGSIVDVIYNDTLFSFGLNSLSGNNQYRSFNKSSADEFFSKWNQAKTTIEGLKEIPKANQILNKISSFLMSGLTGKEEQLRSCRDIKLALAQGKLSPQQLEQLDIRKLEECLDKLPKEIKQIKDVLGRLKSLFKVIEIASIINDINFAIDSRHEWNDIIERIKSNECPNMDALAAKAISYRDKVALGYNVNISTNVASCVGLDKFLAFLGSIGIASSIGAEISMATVAQIAGIVSWAVTDFSIIQGGINQMNDIRWKSEIQNKIPTLKCPKDCGKPGMPPCPDPNPTPGGGNNPGNGGGNGGNGGNGNGGGANQSGAPGDDVTIDPSGYVYEAVPANRVEGVQASIYYKETVEDMYGDLHENVVLWNAEEYAQRNPLFTDENGMYRWDVPQGLWQVKFEKDGYLTAYSEWLPVPPPQLDVNIAITQNRQPEVIEARAYETGVEVQFDKFMDPATLTTTNIFLTASGEKLPGEITLVNPQNATADEGDVEATRYASRVRFVPEESLSITTGEVRVTVSRNVLSYAGIPMTETFSQVLDIEKEVQDIVADDVKVLYGGEKEITVHAVPFDAAVGRTLRVANASQLIATLDTDEFTLDDEGKAVVKVKGALPGRTQLTFSIDDVTVTGTSAVDVVTELITAEAPQASRASGTAVYRGTKVALTTDSKDGVIYFTTDGSCPCDENGTRRKYSVPIVIDGDTRILAMTSVGNGDEDVSEVAEFNYTLKRSDMDFAMPEGWTWISHNFETPVDVATIAADENVARVMSQTQEVIRDPQLGMVGLLQQLNATESYKVETTSATARQRLSDVAWNPATSITLNAGWNWLGYPVGQTMTPAEALANTDAEELDMIVGQNGFAQFDGETWVGTLETLTPGAGYMYQSASAKNVVYNTSIVSNASALHAPGISTGLPLAVDIHRYPSVMPVVANISTADGLMLDNTDYQVTAFCGSECRGIARIVNGMVMMSVYGRTGDHITFHVTDAEGEKQFSCAAAASFAEDGLGDIFSPYAIAIDNHSGISNVNFNGNVKVKVVGDMLVISGIDPADITLLEVYNTDGHKLIHETSVPESQLRISNLSDGVYIVIVNGNGEYTYHKVAIR